MYTYFIKGLSIMATMKNLHIPLPISWYEKLKEASISTEVSATELVRRAIIDFLKEQEKKSISEEISTFALECGGSSFDVDQELQNAGLELIENNI